MRKIQRFAVLICAMLCSIGGVIGANSFTENISYQAVIRNSMNEPVRSSTVGVRISLLMNDSEPNAVYVETHSALTSDGGVVSLAIGTGAPEGDHRWDAIEWNDRGYFIKVEIDPAGGSDYMLTSTTSLMSVPYAKYANKAGSLSRPLSYDQLEGKPQGRKTGDMLFWDASARNWQELAVGMEGQFLCIANGRPTWIDPSFANTTAGSYKVGDVYYNSQGVAEGIVFEVSLTGRYGKIIALKELADLAWDPKGTQEVYDAELVANYPLVTGAKDKNDGEVNTNMIRSLTDYASNYPAFGLAGLGAEWYVPSANELQAIYEVRNAISESLNKMTDADALNQKIYWSSTEQSDFFALAKVFQNTSIVVGEMTIPLYAGENYDALKGESVGVRPVRKLSWNEVTNKPIDAKLYAVGDIIYDETTPVGVVYEISDGGLHGKILSLEEHEASWGVTDVLVGAADQEDGSKNVTEVITTNLGDYPAFKWVSQLGADWYIPSLNEMHSIAGKMALINSFLPKRSHISLSSYWTSTEQDLTNAISCLVDGTPSAKVEVKANRLKVRAIRKF